VQLQRFPKDDNEAYEFREPGEPGNAIVLNECGHCHESINADYDSSVHSKAAANPVLHDVYLGRQVQIEAESECESRGGTWTEIAVPGTGDFAMGCKVETGVQDLGTTGECANCHAPGINGALGGRDLMDAQGAAYDYGVHCDVCHRVESLDPEGAPGVGGAMKLLRPSDKPFSEQLGKWKPLTFGPNGDNVNANMGSVERQFYHEARYCAGCHELEQEGYAAEIDLERWPTGKIPIHSTYSEWETGPMNPAAPCQSCHMPPNPSISNSADLQNVLESSTGVVGGWQKDPGTTRRHTWPGPRSETVPMLQLAAALFVEKEIEDGVLEARVRVKNVGPGHGIPSGEPLRSILLHVEAYCGDTLSPPIGGDVIPQFGGSLEVRSRDEDWTFWGQAEPGQILRVVTLGDGYHDYAGYGPFGDGRFSAEEKGMPIEEYLGEVEILSVNDGVVTLSGDLPDGDKVYRVNPGPKDGELASQGMAGAPGFGFARVLGDAEGRIMVPHYLANDVVSDNRLLPQQSWTSSHQFAVDCEQPRVHARLLYRAYPLELARERGWQLEDQVMTEVLR